MRSIVIPAYLHAFTATAVLRLQGDETDRVGRQSLKVLYETFFLLFSSEFNKRSCSLPYFYKRSELFEKLYFYRRAEKESEFGLKGETKGNARRLGLIHPKTSKC